MKVNYTLVKWFLSISTVLIFFSAQAQVNYSFNGMYMNRAEYRHGQSTLAAPGQDAAFFISQRARLFGEVNINPVTFRLSIQDVRVWGNTSNVAEDNSGQLAIHEAWADLKISPQLHLKMGRQEIKYDEDRIFGNLDWAMQARRHDAAVLMFYDSTKDLHIDAGFAYNQDGAQQAGTIYSQNQYKTFQYLYLSRPIGSINASLMVLNNGYQYQDSNGDYSTIFSHTIGPRLSASHNNISWNTAIYYQGGRNNFNQSLTSLDLMGEVTYGLSESISLTGGFEILTGTSQINPGTNKSNSFEPFYGTNHRFNGYIDYFYVGNHINTVGLQDYYLKSQFSKPKTIIGVGLHFFSAAADVEDDNNPGTVASSYLGSELDLSVTYNLAKNVAIQGGYSQFFATQSLEFVQNRPGGTGETNNWAYVMFIFRPGTDWPRVGLKF